MKDIKENQKGLKSLAAERPDVVKKMGYDPESFYAGGLAMLAAGGEASTNMDPDDAIEEFKNRQQYNEDGILKLSSGSSEAIGGSSGSGSTFSIMSLLGLRGKNNKEKEIKLDPKDEVIVTPNYELSEKDKEKFAELAKKDYNADVSKEYDKLANNITEYNFVYDEKGNLINDPFKKPLTKTEKALAALEGLGALADLDMPEGFTTSGGIGQAIMPTMPNIFRVGGVADGGIMEMANGGMADEQTTRLLNIIDSSPLDADEKELQKQIVRMQLAQQTMVGTPQYIPTDAPYKAVYRPYFSEVTKAYNAARPGKAFSPLAGPPRERVDFNLGMRSDGTLGGPRRVAGVQYAADGMLIDGQFFPETDERVEGPGGERDDKIPAMLSDGEFVVNAKTVRGIGLQAGADPMNFEEQRNIGSKVLEYLQDTMGPRGDMAAKMGEQGLGALVKSMS